MAEAFTSIYFSSFQAYLERTSGQLFDMGHKRIYLFVVLIRCMEAVLQIFTKAAFDRGVSTFVFVFYRQALATLLLGPIAFILDRKRAQPLPFSVCFKSFMLALIGMTAAMITHTVGISYTSPTLASAIVNTVPVITFLLAALLGMESVKPKRLWGIAKLFGIALCVAGVATIAFYTGPYLKPLTHHHLLGHGSSHTDQSSTHPNKAWMLGTLIMTLSNTAWALWLILHGALLKEYPSKLSFMAFQCIFSAIQTLFVALAMERDLSRWNVGLGMGLVGVVYCAIVITGVSFYLQSWCVEKRGPVFLAMSAPLTLIITIVFSSLIYGELINLGRVLGGVLLVGGLYSVLWGKNKEQKESNIPKAEQDLAVQVPKREEKDMTPEVPSPQAP